jgi:hypothetical protein
MPGRKNAAFARDFQSRSNLVERLTGQKPLEMVDYIVKNKAVFS